MMLDHFRRLFDYTEWATERFLEAARGLSEEQFTRELTSSFPTIRDTLAHMAFAEWLWLRRWKGESPSARPEWTKEPSIDVIAMHFRAVAEDRANFLARLTDADLAQDLSYRNLAGTPMTSRFSDLLAHVVNHATYHRGQLTTMLRQVGAAPPSTDLVNMYATQGK